MTAVTPGLGSMSAFTNAGRGLHLFLVHSFLKNNFIYLFIFVCTGFSLLHGLFSRQGEWGLLSSCGAWVSIVVAALIVELGL